MIEIKRRPQAASSPRKSFAGAYHAIYRAIAEYHEQHYPPRLTDEYWQSAVKGISEAAASLDNDPFIIALLEAVYSEMEREYNRATEGATWQQKD